MAQKPMRSTLGKTPATLVTPKAAEAIAKFKSDAVKAIDNALTAGNKADTTAQDVAHFALMHGEAILAAGSNIFKWRSLVMVDGDRKLTNTGKEWIKEVKVSFIGSVVAKPKERTKPALDAYNSYMARAAMVDRGCRLAIAAACYGGTSADYKNRCLIISDSVFLPKVSARTKPEHMPFFMYRGKGQDTIKVPLDGANYMIDQPGKAKDGSDRSYVPGKFTMSQALKSFYATPAEYRTTQGQQTDGNKGADENKSDALDPRVKRAALKGADMLRDMFPEIRAHLEDKSAEPISLAMVDEVPGAMDTFRMLSMVYTRLSTEAIARVNAPKVSNGNGKPNMTQTVIDALKSA